MTSTRECWVIDINLSVFYRVIIERLGINQSTLLSRRINQLPIIRVTAVDDVVIVKTDRRFAVEERWVLQVYMFWSVYRTEQIPECEVEPRRNQAGTKMLSLKKDCRDYASNKSFPSAFDV